MGKMRVKGKETGIVVRLWINDGAHAGIWRERNATPEAQRSGSGLPSPVVLLRVRRALRRDAMSPAERTEAARTGETGGVTIPPAGALAITKAAPGAPADTLSTSQEVGLGRLFQLPAGKRLDIERRYRIRITLGGWCACSEMKMKECGHVACGEERMSEAQRISWR